MPQLHIHVFFVIVIAIAGPVPSKELLHISGITKIADHEGR
jgi:hypothetical protein